jgi:hypothetical protein
MVLRHAKQVLLAQIFSGRGPKLNDGRMCWLELSPSGLSRVMGRVWLETAVKLGIQIRVCQIVTVAVGTKEM